MFSECVSLADSQYFIVILLLIIQVALYRKHLYFQYGVIATLVLLLLYPLILDTLPRESFSILFTVILLLYVIQLSYLFVYSRSPIVIALAIIVMVYAILFFVTTSFLNAALFFTKPVDKVIDVWNTVEKIGAMR